MAEKKIFELEADMYTAKELIEYTLKNPFPENYPQESKLKLMHIFEEQCKKNFIAGYKTGLLNLHKHLKAEIT